MLNLLFKIPDFGIGYGQTRPILSANCGSGFYCRVQFSRKISINNSQGNTGHGRLLFWETRPFLQTNFFSQCERAKRGEGHKVIFSVSTSAVASITVKRCRKHRNQASRRTKCIIFVPRNFVWFTKLDGWMIKPNSAEKLSVHWVTPTGCCTDACNR